MTKSGLSRVRVSAVAAPFAVLLAAPNPAAAEQDYFSGGYLSDFSFAAPARIQRPRPAKPHQGDAKAEKAAAEGRKPQGPLVIAISIQRQQVKIYDSNGLFAEGPISSGMPGHPTPMGVFSIIQKHKYHQSNIYSGAPMPYMQRITWSGVAMHAGVLPGYPASHGCIRMPMSFAMKMWGWTRMGARVVVTPGEVSPVDFSHPVLAALVPPSPVAALPAIANVRTADASGSLGSGLQRIVADAASSNFDVAPANSDAAALTIGAEAALAIEPPAAELSVVAPEQTTEAIDISDGGPMTVPEASMSAAGLRGSSAEATASLAEPAQPVATEAAAAAAATMETRAENSAEPAKTDSHLADGGSAEPVATPLPAMKGNSPVAMFVSRKDGKLYVRQDFKPLFDVPITVAPSDRLLGTHVFTARRDDDGLRWTVVSLPVTPRQASKVDSERGGRRARAAAAEPIHVAAASPDEALSRVAIPAEVMARLGGALPPGSSLVISDQGITQGETGEGTDFIVRLH